MKTRELKNLVAVALGFSAILFTQACATQEAATTVNSANANFVPSDTVSFTSSFPESGATNVPLNSTIQIKFSGGINTQSVLYNQGIKDGISIRVTDEVGAVMPGSVSFNSAQDQIDWVPQLRGRRINLEPATHYNVLVQFVEDPQGRMIAPWFFDFRTVDAATSTGKFHIVSIGKSKGATTGYDPFGSTVLFPSHYIDVQFSEEISPGYSLCSNSTWSDAFQIVDVNIGGVIGAAGNICVICRSVPGGSFCDTLQYRPTTPWVDGSVLRVRVRPTLGLKGISGEPLQKEDSNTLFVFPNLYSVFY